MQSMWNMAHSNSTGICCYHHMVRMIPLKGVPTLVFAYFNPLAQSHSIVLQPHNLPPLSQLACHQPHLWLDLTHEKRMLAFNVRVAFLFIPYFAITWPACNYRLHQFCVTAINYSHFG